MKKTKKQYLLLPCSGNKNLGNATNHLYEVKTPDGKNKGWMSLEDALKLVEEEKEKIFVSVSHSACPECYKLFMGESE